MVTETKTKVGTYYNADQTLMSEESTEWDMITGLAQQEGFVAYVEKDNLIFKPEPTNQDPAYILNYIAPNINNKSPSFPAMHLGFFRSMTIAQDVMVTVRVPSSPGSKKAFNVTVTSKKRPRPYIKGLPKPNARKQKYVRVIPGLSREQALQRAQQILRNISVHEINLVASMPGDNSLKKDTMIQITGTNSAFDQFYFADHVVRKISIYDGYTMEVNAKNHSVDSEVTL
jgi:phage protein D